MKNSLLLSSTVLFTCVVFISAIPANAQFGGLGGLVGGGNSNSSNTMSSDDLVKNVSSLNLRFSKSMSEMMQAQSFTQSALGNKAKADELSAKAKSLDGSNDINVISRSVSVSEDASKEIDEKMASSGALDAQGKATLALATPHYAAGMLQAAQLPGEYTKWVSNAQAAVNGNPMAAISLIGRLKDVISVTSNLPGLVSAWSTTTGNFSKFARSNKVDTSNLASKY